MALEQDRAVRLSAARAALVAPKRGAQNSLLSLDGRLNLTAKETVQVLGSVRIFQRAKYHGWLLPLCQSRDALYPVSRVRKVQQRMEGGEMPPLLPSEVKQRPAGARKQGRNPEQLMPQEDIYLGWVGYQPSQARTKRADQSGKKAKKRRPRG